jgi:predicted GNAT family acetyltransferase
VASVEEELRAALSGDVEEFERALDGWLDRRPLEHNTLLTAVHGQRARQALSGAPPTYGWVTGAGGPAGALVWTPPFLAQLSVMAPAPAAALARTLAGRAALPGVTGPADAAAAFAEAWTEATGRRHRRDRQLRIFRCDAVRDVPEPPGRLRPAEPAEADLLTGWFAVAMSGGGLAREHARRAVDQELAAGRLSVWDDGGPVAFGGGAPPVAGVARLHGAYSPPELRGRGYTRAVAAGVTRRALEAGSTTCMAITDDANQVVNRVLEQVGYRPVRELAEYRFG